MTGSNRIGRGAAPSQIEHQIQIALMAKQNPDLSFKLIQELLKAKSEPVDQEYTFG